MKQIPSNFKYKKPHKKKKFKGIKGIDFNVYPLGLRNLSKGKYMTYNQFEVVRRIFSRALKQKKIRETKNVKFIKSRHLVRRHMQKYKYKQRAKRKKQQVNTNYMVIRTNIQQILTKKPLQVRMGKGKGNAYKWVYPVNYARVLCEISTKNKKLKVIRKLCSLASKKMSGRTKFFFNRYIYSKELNLIRIRHNKEKKLKIYKKHDKL